MLLNLCCQYGQQSRVAKLSLIICDILSAKLNMHSQPYLLMHTITAMLIFVGERCCRCSRRPWRINSQNRRHRQSWSHSTNSMCACAVDER